MIANEIIKSCADATNLSEDKCDEVLKATLSTIGRYLKEGRHVVIDGFGTFGPIEQKQKIRVFRPAPELMERVTAGGAVQENGTCGNIPHLGPGVQEPPESAGGAGGGTVRPAILPVLKRVRPEDETLIERWLIERGAKLSDSQAVDRLLYREDDTRVWSEETIKLARRILQAFARRSPIPLVQVGLEADLAPGIMRGSVVINAYARDYVARSRSRLSRLVLWREAAEQQRIEIALRTQGWTTFFRYAQDFYTWMANKNLRHAGTNPLAGMNSAYRRPIDFNKDGRIMERARCIEMLEYPHLSVKDRAILYLTANGLRATEVGRAKLENLTLSQAEITIVGKGSKQRTVDLFPWTVAALDAYLLSRRYSTNPHLFPNQWGQATTQNAVYLMIRQIRDCVFPRSDQKSIRRNLTPHKFRHFFVSELERRGARLKLIMRQTGHSNVASVMRYSHVDREEARDTIAKIAKKPWFKAPA